MNVPRDDAEIIAHLDQELLSLELDAASLEYFSHAAFDERIDALLENADLRETVIKLSGYTPQVILDEELEPNDLAANQPITHFSITAEESRSQEGLRYAFDLSSEGTSDSELQLRLNEQGTYDVYSKKTDRILNLNPYEAATLVFRAMDLPIDSLQGLSGLFGEYANEYHGFIRKVMRIGAEAREGTITTDHYFQRKMIDDVRNAEAEIRLGFKQTETSEYSAIHVSLEKAFVYPELGSEEVYRLDVFYDTTPTEDLGDQGIKTGDKAIKAIRGDGGLSLKSIRLIHEDQGGKVTPLDTTDPTIMQDFIEVYEFLLQDAA